MSKLYQLIGFLTMIINANPASSDFTSPKYILNNYRKPDFGYRIIPAGGNTCGYGMLENKKRLVDQRDTPFLILKKLIDILYTPSCLKLNL